MPVFSLCFDAECAGVRLLARTDGTPYLLTLRCSTCGEESKEIAVNPEEEVEVPGSRGKANMVYSCKGCRAHSSIYARDLSPYEIADGQLSKAAVAEIEVRGSQEVRAWSFLYYAVQPDSDDSPVFIAHRAEEDFCEYDEVGSQEVTVLDCKYTVE